MGDEGVKTGKYLIKMSSFVLAIMVSASSFVFIGFELDTLFSRPVYNVVIDPIEPVYLTNECDAQFYRSLVGMKADAPYILENYHGVVFIDPSREKYLYDSNSYKAIIIVKKDNDGIIREILCK